MNQENERRLKILMVSDDMVPAITGVGIHVYTIAKELASRGHNVSVLTASSKPHLPSEETLDGITILRCPTLTIAGFPQAIPSRNFLEAVFSRVNPDVVHHHYFSFLYLMTLLTARRKKTPQILTYHFSPDILSQPFFMRPFRKLINWGISYSYNFMDMIIKPSKNALILTSSKKFRGEICHVLNPLAFQKPQTFSFKQPSSRLNILFAGRLAVEKNIPLLIRSTLQLKKMGFPFRLMIAGDGPLKSDLIQMVSQSNLTDSVEFLGHLNHAQLEEEYRRADVFVLPSVIETLSLVAIEAMSFGCPLIVTNKILCAEELVENGRNGFIVDSEDETELTDKLIRLKNEPQLFSEMQLAAYRFSERFEPSKIAAQVESLYLRMNTARNSHEQGPPTTST